MKGRADNMAKGIPVTPQEFDRIKILLEEGFSAKQIAEMKNRDVDTIKMIHRSKDFQDYFDRRKAINESKRTPKAKNPQENRQTVTIQATNYMMQELQKTNELLTGISAKLAFIVDELTK